MSRLDVNSKSNVVESRPRATLIVVGVGYRVELVNKVGLSFDVGLSHQVPFARPDWVKVTVDSSCTKCELEVKAGTENGRIRLGDLCHKICRIRPRSPYTGNGILLVGKKYPVLKSTKVAKK